MSDKLNLEIITQESHLLNDSVDSVSVPTVLGEVTILPHHLSLFTKLEIGELTYKKAGDETRYVIAGGFMDVSGGKKVTILADAAIRSDKVNLAQAQAAKERAEKLMAEKTSDRDFALAEAQLKKSLLELKVARRRKLNESPSLSK